MEFHPECIEALGEAALLLDGDTVYVCAPSWMIVIPQAYLHIPEQVLDILYARENHETPTPFLTDWRVLAADVLSTEEMKFLPHRGHRSIDIELRSYSLSRVTVPYCRARLDQHRASVWGEVSDLTALYDAGRADPIYSEPNPGADEFAKSSRAVSYTFEFFSELDPDLPSARRVLRLDAAKFDALCDLGFQVSAPMEHTAGSYSSGSNYQPAAGLYKDVEGGSPIVGMLLPEEDARRDASDDGRTLLVDASRFCWMEEEDALALLHDPESYPVQVEASASAMAMNAYCPSALTLALGWLRWNGYPEDVINEMYESGRLDAYHQQLRDLEYLIDRSLERVWESPVVSPGDAQKMLNSLEDAQGEVELLCEALGIKVNYQPIWNLRSALEEQGGAA